jgi:hypothetical protein
MEQAGLDQVAQEEYSLDTWSWSQAEATVVRVF